MGKSEMSKVKTISLVVGGFVAGAMISVTGLVFSITMVVVQLASSQFTPRLLGSFLLRDVCSLPLRFDLAALQVLFLG